MLHLDDATILRLLDLPTVTERVAGAYAAWGTGRAATTQRVRAAAGGSMASAMAAVVPPYSGGKVYATAAGRFTFVVALFDLDGGLLCTVDGDALTRLRTPATAAVAVRHLAAPRPTVAAVLGTGRQAWGHLAMLRQELPGLVEARVHGRRPEAVTGLVERALAAGIPAKPAESADAAVEGADVVVTVTSAHEPLFTADSLGDRTLICAMGATKPDRAEIGADVVSACRVVVADDLTGSRHECGDLVRAAAAGAFDWDRAVELHAVVAGAAAVPRAGAGPVLFESQGVALQDVAAAGLAWERHLAEATPPGVADASPTTSSRSRRNRS
jgi:ornithine cyclodeaminase